MQVSGRGVQSHGVLAGITTAFTVHTNQADNAKLQVVIKNPEGKSIHASIQANAQGASTVTYCPDVVGCYNVAVKYAGNHVSNSPFLVKAGPAGDDIKAKLTAPSTLVNKPPYEGFTTMNLSMPMCTQLLPVAGSCTVQGTKVLLTYPTTIVTFDLPHAPEEGKLAYTFQIRNKLSQLDIHMDHISELGCHTGKAVDCATQDTVLHFHFYKPDSAMTVLPTPIIA